MMALYLTHRQDDAPEIKLGGPHYLIHFCHTLLLKNSLKDIQLVWSECYKDEFLLYFPVYTEVKNQVKSVHPSISY